MPTHEKRRPAGNGAASETTGCQQHTAGLRRRRDAAHRLPSLDCGHRDPWTCRHHDDGPPSERLADSYADAARHLDALGLCPYPFLPEMRVLWRQSDDDRRLVREITERWAVA